MTEPVIVDARGLRCPVPIITIAAAAREAAVGTEIELLANDPSTGPDLAAWCRMRGHTLGAPEKHAEYVRYRVRIEGSPGTQGASPAAAAQSQPSAETSPGSRAR